MKFQEVVSVFESIEKLASRNADHGTFSRYFQARYAS